MFDDDEGSLGGFESGGGNDDGSLGGFGGDDDDDGSLGGLVAPTPTKNKEPSWDEDIADIVDEHEEATDKNGKKKKKKKSQAKTYQTSKEDMMTVFGFNQGSCDFCQSFVADIITLQKCMCNKKYFCTECMKHNSKVAEHQQECAKERFERMQKKRERAGRAY